MIDNQAKIIKCNKPSGHENYSKIRLELVNLIKNVNNKLKFRTQTFFLAVNYMDIIFSSNNLPQHNYILESKPHLLSICCLLIAGN
jgi:hypothetical protein